MNKNKKYVHVYALVLVFTFFWWIAFARPTEDLNKFICRDAQLYEYSIKAYKNNMSDLAKFHYKRTESCIDLMNLNRKNRNPITKFEKCGVLDAMTESVVPLTQLLVSNGERDTAKAELVKVAQAMEPYSYCGIKYETNMKTIARMKKLSEF